MTVIIDCAAISCETSSSFCLKRNCTNDNEEKGYKSESNKVAINNWR